MSGSDINKIFDVLSSDNMRIRLFLNPADDQLYLEGYLTPKSDLSGILASNPDASEKVFIEFDTEAPVESLDYTWQDFLKLNMIQ